MPWNENNGGNSGGPWGSPPPGGGGRGGGGQPPDLEDLLKKGQERFKGALPGGDLSGSAIVIGLLILIAIWGASGIYTVQPEQQGVVTRFGKFSEITQPGLNYHLPFPIETVYTPRVTTNNRIDVGVLGNRDVPSESLMLTGDENIVNIHFAVFWQIKPATLESPGGAADYLFNVENPDQTIKSVAESAMRTVIGTQELEPIITKGREIVETETQQLVQATLDLYKTGILVTGVQLLKADPPDQVIDAFLDVVAAEQDQDTRVNEARAYANDIVPKARGDAQRIIQAAEAYRAQTVVEANGEATRFTSILSEYKQAPDVTRERMFLETMERVLRGKDKVVIDIDSGSGVVPYLPLPEVDKRRGGAQ